MTVRGLIDPAELGPTLMHEHLFIRFTLPFDEPERWARLGLRVPRTPEELALWNQPFTVRDRMKLMGVFYRNRDAYTLDDVATTVSEVQAYQALGGRTIVDVTTTGIGPHPEKIREVVERTGINVVMGTGFYRYAWHPADLAQRSIDDLAAHMVRELTVGFGSTGIRAGIIGEIPAETIEFEPKESDEVRVLRAAARASRLTGAAITIHGDMRRMQHLHTAVDILEREGADLSRVILGHMTHEAAGQPGLLESLLARGVYLQFDILGNPLYLDLPTRPMVDAIERLIQLGHSERVLVSQDVCTKMQLVRNGGYGFTFVHTALVPWLRRRGVMPGAIDNLLVNNPRRVLTFAAPEGAAGRASRS
jgi:phosphotriesterase-related protein